MKTGLLDTISGFCFFMQLLFCFPVAAYGILQGLHGFVVYDQWTRFYSGSAWAFTALGCLTAAVAGAGATVTTCFRSRADLNWWRFGVFVGTAVVLSLTVVFFVAVFAIRPGQTDALKGQMRASLKDYNTDYHVKALWDELQASFV